MGIRRMGPDDVDLVIAAGRLFDTQPTEQFTRRFLGLDGHHLLLAFADGEAVGMITGVEMTHPDKGTEMFLYELGVDERHRRKGIATALVGALADLARQRSCYGMWVATEHDNEAALATYRRAGSSERRTGVTLDWTFEPAHRPS